MNFFKKLFGGKSKGAGTDIEKRLEESLTGLMERGGFEFDFEMTSGTDDKGEPQVVIEMTGPDEELLKENEGQMIEALQLFLKRVLQHHFPEDRTNVVIDSNGFREESSQALIDLADKLKGVALEKGKPVYFRALSPKDRKVVHQYLANDQRVRSRSIGEGLFKKIKIFPVKSGTSEEAYSDRD